MECPISLSRTQVSGSMQGEKITQLQDAMFTILDDMTEDDYFSILTFNYDVQVFGFLLDTRTVNEPTNVFRSGRLTRSFQ